MPSIELKPKVIKFIKTLPKKHAQQVKNSILSLENNPIPHDAKKLKGYKDYLRIDVGEYRVIYRYDTNKKVITIMIAGHRNDGKVYKIAKRNL